MQTPPEATTAITSLAAPSVPQVSAASRFIERRNSSETPVRDRRQFASSHSDLSEDARELALAIDGYKAKHRRRYITFEEMLTVIHQLGYQRD